MTALYLISGEKMLLLFRQGSRVANNVWIGCAGGHFEEHELNDAKACILRELYEEMRVTEDMLSGLRLRYVTLRRTENEIRQNYYFFAEIDAGEELKLSSCEGMLRWFSFEELIRLDMPFTARYVIEHYVKIGRFTDNIYAGVADGSSVLFTSMPAF